MKPMAFRAALYLRATRRDLRYLAASMGEDHEHNWESEWSFEDTRGQIEKMRCTRCTAELVLFRNANSGADEPVLQAWLHKKPDPGPDSSAQLGGE